MNTLLTIVICNILAIGVFFIIFRFSNYNFLRKILLMAQGLVVIDALFYIFFERAKIFTTRDTTTIFPILICIGIFLILNSIKNNAKNNLK